MGFNKKKKKKLQKYVMNIEEERQGEGKQQRKQ
jgi:hypothetical protein